VGKLLHSPEVALYTFSWRTNKRKI